MVRDRTFEMVPGEVELDEDLQRRPGSRRDLAGEFVAGEDDPLELGAVGEGVWDVAREGVVGEVKILEVREVEDGRWKFAGEVVTMEEDAVERGGVEELRRDGAVEGVGVEAQAAEVEEVTELRREVAAKALAGEGDADDAGVRVAGDVAAADAGPPAGICVGIVPVGECGGADAVNGGF